MQEIMIDGKHIKYDSKTQFVVQVKQGGRPYSDRARITGDLIKAVRDYSATCVGVGCAKRLVLRKSSDEVLARYIR